MMMIAEIRELFEALKSVLINTNYQEFMARYFPETPPRDGDRVNPCYADTYHIDKWMLFRDNVFGFYCACDDFRQKKLVGHIREYIERDE
tara:strand:+ start:3705 stop:3974 length:270 start_codon:yes stop_codon:yes gene_type:complete